MLFLIFVKNDSHKMRGIESRVKRNCAPEQKNIYGILPKCQTLKNAICNFRKSKYPRTKIYPSIFQIFRILSNLISQFPYKVLILE